MIYDHAGRLVFDGEGVYQYDCWGRLVQVSDVGSATVTAQGQVSGTLGGLVVHYTYDALGRLISRQTPWDSSRDSLRIERFHHDGARRIQEIVSTEVPVAAPVAMDTSRWPSGAASGLAWSIDREYVHVPAAAGGYVDEYLAQFDGAAEGGNLGYILQDANFNVIGVANAAGEPGAQYSYYPYGVVKTASIFDNTFGGSGAVRIGHQGLFFDRLDEPWTSERLIAAGAHGNAGWMGGDAESMTGRGVYQNRNRSYEPGLGRFLQRDVHGSGQGLALEPFVLAFDAGSLHANGMTVHAYVAGNPIARADPEGLEFSLAGALMTGFDMAQSATGAMEEGYQGVVTAFNLGRMLDEYAFMQEADIDWALDWDAHDFDYFSSGLAAEAWGYSYLGDDEEEFYEDGGDHGPAMAGAGRLFHGNSKKSRAKTHNYKIEYKKPGQKWAKAKNGVSGKGLTKAGRSKRAEFQIAKYRQQHPKNWEFRSRIVKTSDRRSTSLNREYRDSQRDLRRNPTGLPGQQRPRPGGLPPGPW